MSNVDKIYEYNRLDLIQAKGKRPQRRSFIDRLTLTDSRIRSMADGMDAIINRPIPWGKSNKNTPCQTGLR